MKLDHATVVTPHLETVRQFFCTIVGLTDGERPPFRFDGHWLYHEGQTRRASIKSNAELPSAKQSSRIDNFAFRVENDTDWDKLIARLHAADIQYRSTELPATRERQLFVTPTPGVMIEFVTAAAA